MNKWPIDTGFAPTGPVFRGTLTGGGVAVADEKVEATTPSPDRSSAEPQPRSVPVCEVQWSVRIDNHNYTCPGCGFQHVVPHWSISGKPLILRCDMCGRFYSLL